MKLHELNITPSHSRPRVRNDNAYAESLFCTLKSVPQWPSSGFRMLEDARNWVTKFTRWYNEEHCHSGIRYVTPGERHRGEDRVLLEKGDALYREAQKARPERENRRHKLTKSVNYLDTYRTIEMKKPGLAGLHAKRTMELSSFLLFFEFAMQLISFKLAVLHHMGGRLK